jgi:hypothetical protein
MRIISHFTTDSFKSVRFFLFYQAGTRAFCNAKVLGLQDIKVVKLIIHRSAQRHRTTAKNLIFSFE